MNSRFRTDNLKPLMIRLNELGWVTLESSAVFISRDCLLLQSFTGKRFSYKAINFISGEGKYLFHRNNEMSFEEIIDIEKRIKELPFYNTDYPSDGPELISHIFENIFTLYGYTIRKDQIKLSTQMYESMISNSISLSDIPVGLGKTHAYLVAAVVHRIFHQEVMDEESSSIIVTTSSIELQRAIVIDYLPEISKMLLDFGIIHNPITCVLRKGKDHYLCDVRLKNYVKTIDPKKKNIDELIVLRSIEQQNKIDLDEIKGISNYDRKRICVNQNACENCKIYNLCRYQRFMRMAKKSQYHFQICNHNYYLADLLRRKKGLPPLLPDYRVTIFDEAHKFIEAARQMYGAILSQREIYMLVQKSVPKRIKTNGAKQLKKTCDELLNESSIFFLELTQNIEKETNNDEAEKFTTVITPAAKVCLGKMITKMEELIRNSNTKERKYQSDLRRCVNELKTFQRWDIIYWLENPYQKDQCMLVSIPITLNKEIREDLWTKFDSKILTSGTIAVKDNFDFIKNELGLKIAAPHRIKEISKDSPFDFFENCLLHIPKNLPFPNYNDGQYYEEMANRIERLVNLSNGHSLVLFSSYKPLKIIYEKLENRLKDFPIIQMRRGQKDVVEAFKKTVNGVLFATGSVWEGVNIPGDLLSHLIIVKLPFPIPDPISEYERTMYPSMEDFLDKVILPQMLMKLKQGVGRLIRTEKDSGVISILDSRASMYAKYHSAVLEALPKCRVIEDEKEIRDFLEKKKDKNYFDN